MSQNQLSLQECLKRADKLGKGVLKSQRSVRDAVYIHQCGSVPRLSTEERLAAMSEDEKQAIEMIAKIAEEYEGNFLGFTTITPSRPSRPIEIPTEPKPPPLKKPRASKKCFKDAQKLAVCMENLVGSDKSEPTVQAAAAVCLCGTVK